MNEFLNCAIEAAKDARKLILDYYRRNLQVEIKTDRTPVTQADREAEQVIRDRILKRFPDHGFCGEELGQQDMHREYLWLVDPIDGTKSFIQGYGFFSTQIALMHQGELVLGVSCAPAMNELAWASKGQGAFLNGDRIQTGNQTQLQHACLSMGNIHSLASSDAWGRFGDLVTGMDRTRGYGDYYHYHRLAAGQLDIVLESDLNILDIAALVVIVREAGGIVTTLSGQDINLQTTSVLAANPVLHAAMLQGLQYNETS